MIQSNEDFIKNYNEERNERYFIEADVQYPEKLYELHNDLSFLPERMKVEKVEKLVTNLHDKNEFVIHIRNSKQPLSERLILKKKYHRGIKFNQNAWLKPHIDINTRPRQKANNNFEKDFFKIMNNAVFEKTMENMKKQNIKLIKTEKRINYLASESNHYTTKFFTENVLVIEIRKNSNINE